MQKQTLASLFIGILMLTSVAGFAMSGRLITQQPQTPQQVEIPLIVNRSFTPSEITTLVRQGRLIIQSVYSMDCANCTVIDQELQTFTNTYRGFIFMSSVPTNVEGGFQTLQMITATGQIVPLDPANVTQESLKSIFCEVSYVKPRDCLLQSIFVQQPQVVENTTDTNVTDNLTMTDTILENTTTNETNLSAI